MPTVFVTNVTSLKRQFCCRLLGCSLKNVHSKTYRVHLRICHESGTIFSCCQFSDPLGLRSGKPIPSHRLSCVHKKGAVSERHSWFSHDDNALLSVPHGIERLVTSLFLQQSGKQDTRYSGTPKILAISVNKSCLTVHTSWNKTFYQPLL